GAIDLPFKTLDAAFAAVGSGSGSAYLLEVSPGSYTPSGNLISPGGKSITINGNGSSVNVGSFQLIISGPYNISNLNVTGAVLLVYAGTVKSYWLNGSISGNLSVSGIGQMSNTQLTGATVHIFASSSPYFTGVRGTGQFITAASTSLLFIANSNITYAGAGPAIDASAGGQLYLADMYVANVAGPTINCADGATLSAPNVFNVMIIGG